MGQASTRTVLFADLRGSTGLFESLGNRAATEVVSRCVIGIAAGVASDGGTVVKTLGDGVLAFFPTPSDAVRAALRMHEVLERTVHNGETVPLPATDATPRLHVAISHGEVVEWGADCYGDAINVAARLLEHATDRETLITGAAHEALDATRRGLFRRLGPLSLRGRAEPVDVLACGGRRPGDDATTLSEVVQDEPQPAELRLSGVRGTLSVVRDDLPLLIGRAPPAAYRIDHPKVSRTHSRLEWQGDSFVLCDLSFNGTYVSFARGDGVLLRRSVCVLHGRGRIHLGPSAEGAWPELCIDFEVRHPDVAPGRSRSHGNAR